MTDNPPKVDTARFSLRAVATAPFFFQIGERTHDLKPDPDSYIDWVTRVNRSFDPLWPRVALSAGKKGVGVNQWLS